MSPSAQPPAATPALDGLQVWMVGGAVRDTLLGLPVTDRDWVVIGASAQEMSERGFTPVGKDFPVFLHPQTREEYALARTERKNGHGYKGFLIHASPAVTLEQDLARRDLTINALAAPPGWTGDAAHVIDPHGGLADLRQRRLRHITPAFSEDPVRILRLARFAARLPHFHIASATLALLRQMVSQGEAAHLVPERVWQELSRGLMQTAPHRMIDALHASRALAAALPEIRYQPALLARLQTAARLQAPLPVRYACLAWPAPQAHLTSLATRLRPPADCHDLARLLTRLHPAIAQAHTLPAAALLELLQQADALRRPERFAQLLLAAQCTADEPGTPAELPPWPPARRLLTALAAAQSVPTAAIARQTAATGGPSAIAQAIHAARLQAITQALPAP